MKSNKIVSWFLPVLGGVFIAATASAQTSLLNFTAGGASTNLVSSPDGNGHYWNNITGGAGNYNPGLDTIANNGGSSATSVALLTTANGSPGWSLSMSNWTGSGIQGDTAVGSGPFSSNLTAVWPVTALQAGDQIHYNNGAPGVSIILSGLNTGDTYNLLFYGYDTSQNTAETTVLSGGTSASPNSVTFANIGQNTNTLAEWDNITPTAGGQIILDVTVGSNYADGAVNAMELTVAPEPGSIALFGLGVAGLAFAQRFAKGRSFTNK